MSIIQSLDPEHYLEAQDALDTQITTKAISEAEDDDYSISRDLFDVACNENEIRKLLNTCAAQRLKGQHPDCLELAVKLTKLAADYYRDRAADSID